MIEFLMELAFKIALTGLTLFIVMLMADSFCKSAHEGQIENKNVKYETPVFIEVVGSTSFYTMCGCIVASILMTIWA